MNKWLKILLISLAVLSALFLLGNLGINLWLKNNLPDYIRKNSAYNVSYQSLDVELATGSIISRGIKIASKEPNNQNVIGLDGTVDSLSISRLGLWDAVVNKRINSSDLTLVKPNLKITLAKPIDDKTGKKRNPVLFKNIKIKDGNIIIFRHTKQKFVSVNNLFLNVYNLRMTEESVEDKLPVVFDDYNIKGTNFYFRPDNVYALKADNITTENGQMSIKNFHLVPLLSYAQFLRYYPKKRNLFDFKTKVMNFKNIVLKDNKIALAEVKFENPELTMFTTNVKPNEKEKSFKYEVNLQDVALNNAKVQILKPNGHKLFSAGNMNLNVSKLLMDEETAKGNIPFSYEKFLIAGTDFNYVTDFQDVKLRSFAANPKSVESRDIEVKPLVNSAKKPLLNLSLKHIYANVNNWKLENSKLLLDVNNIVLDHLNGSFTTPENNDRKKLSLRQLMLPLKVKNITLKNSNIRVERSDRTLALNNLFANLQDVEINQKTAAQNIPFKVGSCTFTTKNFLYKTKFYTFSASLFKFQKGNFLMNDFMMKPNFSRAQFIRQIPTEKDLYDIEVKQITGVGHWDFVSDNKFLKASNVQVSGANANIFRSKVPKDDISRKPMYSELLRNINFPLFVQNLDVKNSTLVYEEDTKKSDGPGKLLFGNLNLNLKNLNSHKAGQPTKIPISITCSFMNVSPMKVKWNLDTASMSDAFNISGNISDLPAASINPFVEPYLKIRTTGYISDLIFNFTGNKAGLDGSLNMKHKDLKVSVLKESGEKNKLLSAIANLVVRTNSKNYPESVVVDDVKRDPTKSFFNLFWKGIEEGLKKTLIGDNIEKTEANAKDAIKASKNAIQGAKQDFQDATEAVKDKVSNTKGKLQATKEDIIEKKKKVGDKLKNIFRKKEKAEN